MKKLPAVNPPGTRRLEVACDHVTLGLRATRPLGGVRAATVFGQSMHLLVEETLPEESIRETLLAVGIHKVEIRTIAPSLEDVFVALTAQYAGAP